MRSAEAIRTVNGIKYHVCYYALEKDDYLLLIKKEKDIIFIDSSDNFEEAKYKFEKYQKQYLGNIISRL